MDITPLVPKGRQIITGYGDGGFKINQVFVGGSLLVFPERSIAWDVKDAASLTPKHFQEIMDSLPPVELVLLGTGKSMQMADSAIKTALKARGIALDVMDTGAACRTYNVLMSEERRVAAALIAV